MWMCSFIHALMNETIDQVSLILSPMQWSWVWRKTTRLLKAPHCLCTRSILRASSSQTRSASTPERAQSSSSRTLSPSTWRRPVASCLSVCSTFTCVYCFIDLANLALQCWTRHQICFSLAAMLITHTTGSKDKSLLGERFRCHSRTYRIEVEIQKL